MIHSGDDFDGHSRTNCNNYFFAPLVLLEPFVSSTVAAPTFRFVRVIVAGSPSFAAFNLSELLFGGCDSLEI